MDQQAPSEAGKPAPRTITAEDRAEAARRVQRGEEVFQSGDALGAAKEFLAAVEADPGSAKAWNDLGVTLHGLGEVKDAQLAFQSALRIDPADVNALSNMEALGGFADGDQPWPLATAAPYRFLAWPDYGSSEEMEALMTEFGSHLLDNTEVCLCLRFDPECDGSEEAAVGALRVAHRRALGPDAVLQVLMVDDPMTREDWARLGSAVQGVLMLESSARQPRMSFGEAVQVPKVESGGDLCARLQQLGYAPGQEAVGA